MEQTQNQPQQTSNASLYVGELDQAVSEAMLFELFSQIGPVASIRVCRDAVTRRSLGYAYVNYHNLADGERALEELNYTELLGKSIRIMWSQRDPSLRRSVGTGNIFIKNLDPSIDNKTLHDTFSAFGHILSCKVAADENGSKGYGFVHFQDQEAAEAAINSVNGMLLNDKKVFVGYHIPRKERQSKMDEMKSKFTNVYVKNLDETVDDEEFKQMFEPFGTVTSAVLSKFEDGKSKGFGFVNFETHEAAAAAVEKLHETEHKGKQLYVARAQKKSEREDELRRQYEKQREEKMSQGVNLYVKNLDETITDDMLRAEFEPFGSITSAKVMVDEKTRISKGFGFVCFSSPDEATKAVTEMNGKMLANKPLYVALAQKREVRRQLLASQMQQRAAQMRMQPPLPGVGPYPGAPMFYPGPVPQPGRGGVFFPQQPMVRPRYANPAGQPGYPPQAMPQQFGAVPVQSRPQPQGGSRPPRPQGGNVRPQMQGGQPPRNRPYKYASTARNVPGQTSSSSASGPKLSASTLAELSPQDQKRLLGEHLFPLISEHAPSVAPKITGMLLEMDNAELLLLLETPDMLKQKVEEAVEALEEYLKASEGQE